MDMEDLEWRRRVLHNRLIASQWELNVVNAEIARRMSK
jgi:hypothetical protein